MHIKEINDKNIWESFFAQREDRTFFQSWNWGEFRRAVGEKVWRLGIYEEGQLIAVALVSKKVARRGTYIEISHGPSCVQFGTRARGVKKEVLETLLEKLKKIAAEEGASFVRMSPLWERNDENSAVFRGLGFRQAPMYAAYESSWKLDITLGEENLMKNMRKTTRYLIRQTGKDKNIEVRQSLEAKDIQQFHSLSSAVGERQKFIPFSREDTEKEIIAFKSDNEISLFLGLYKGKPVAAALVVFWSGVGFYHQGASLGEYAKFSIPYLVQWEAIREAKRRGCTLYDFWGYVDPKKYPKHPWAGPTVFKMGFGGKAYEYVKTQDYPLSLRYWPTAIFENIRAKRRGL
jgi:peptidoglycan pentaglycine glycine transferase (the first glycine)